MHGVGFRDFTRRHAGISGSRGWVMNLPDGRVRVWAEGPREAIEALVQALEQGPRLARVDRVAVTWCEAIGVRARPSASGARIETGERRRRRRAAWQAGLMGTLVVADRARVAALRPAPPASAEPRTR